MLRHSEPNTAHYRQHNLGGLKEGGGRREWRERHNLPRSASVPYLTRSRHLSPTNLNKRFLCWLTTVITARYPCPARKLPRRTIHPILQSQSQNATNPPAGGNDREGPIPSLPPPAGEEHLPGCASTPACCGKVARRTCSDVSLRERSVRRRC
ncbi:hypothetical protein E2C01_007107 [Portunus trituberculatus]|uniref:Uncharacterized protein n=1 Tax=Portunus trituberculatus TaxID=210409 RepID=A0A5B7D3L6_PORTR|nr:hypothetical protein [Portunus trituberculatus]